MRLASFCSPKQHAFHYAFALQPSAPRMFWSYPRLVWGSKAAHASTASACYSFDSIARRLIETAVAGVLVSEWRRSRLTVEPAEG